jgi:quercetin dioxygenase-like cupin family protein
VVRQRGRPTTRGVFGVAILTTALLALLLAACGDDDDAADAGWSAYATEVVRNVVEEGEPASATGQLLELTQVIVPGGMEIAPHTHPGLQLALIVDGTLTYSVIEGEVEVKYDFGKPEERTEMVGAGGTVELTPGTAVKEVPGMVHEARNERNRAVVIYLSSLFPVGAPASSPAE